MKLSSFTSSLCLAVLLSAPQARALVVNNFDANVHDFDRSTNRDTTPKDFIGKQFDWSGVGLTSGTERWITLIDNPYGPNKFGLSAYHFPPNDTLSVTFYQHDTVNGDINGTPGAPLYSETRNVVAVHPVYNVADDNPDNDTGLTDLVVVELDAGVDSSKIQAYSIYSGSFNNAGQNADPSNGDVTDIAFLVGRGGGSTIRVGTSVTNPSVQWQNSFAVNDSFMIFYPTTPTGFPPPSPTIDQAYGEGGDSGGPSFIAPVSNSQNANGYYGMTIVGVNSQAGTSGTYATVAQKYTTQVNTIMQTYSIPEPAATSFLLGCTALLLILIVRRRIAT